MIATGDHNLSLHGLLQKCSALPALALARSPFFFFSNQTDFNFRVTFFNRHAVYIKIFCGKTLDLLY